LDTLAQPWTRLCKMSETLTSCLLVGVLLGSAISCSQPFIYSIWAHVSHTRAGGLMHPMACSQSQSNKGCVDIEILNRRTIPDQMFLYFNLQNSLHCIDKNRRLISFDRRYNTHVTLWIPPTHPQNWLLINIENRSEENR